MRLLVILTVAIICCDLVLSISASSKLRRKRLVALEKCPKDSTTEKCRTYAQEQSKIRNYPCFGFHVAGGLIEWKSCEETKCNKGLIRISGNPAKPYPDCCAHCEVFLNQRLDESGRY